MKYYGELKKEGMLSDMTMAEFADYYRQKKTYTEPECAALEGYSVRLRQAAVLVL